MSSVCALPHGRKPAQLRNPPLGQGAGMSLEGDDSAISRGHAAGDSPGRDWDLGAEHDRYGVKAHSFAEQLRTVPLKDELCRRRDAPPTCMLFECQANLPIGVEPWPCGKRAPLATLPADISDVQSRGELSRRVTFCRVALRRKRSGHAGFAVAARGQVCSYSWGEVRAECGAVALDVVGQRCSDRASDG